MAMWPDITLALTRRQSESSRQGNDRSLTDVQYLRPPVFKLSAKCAMRRFIRPWRTSNQISLIAEQGFIKRRVVSEAPGQ